MIVSVPKYETIDLERTMEISEMLTTMCHEYIQRGRPSLLTNFIFAYDLPDDIKETLLECMMECDVDAVPTAVVALNTFHVMGLNPSQFIYTLCDREEVGDAARELDKLTCAVLSILPVYGYYAVRES